MVLRRTLIGMMLVSTLSGAEYSSSVAPCNKLLPSWAYNRGECSDQSVHYTHNEALTRLFGGQTSIHYALKKNDTTETASMGADYSHDQFFAQLQGSYIKGRFDTTPSTGNTNLLVRYHKKLWDSLALSASENVYIPTKTPNDQIDPLKYTSLLKALYPVNDFYKVFAEGSYSVLQVPSAENTEYRNPYSYTTGLTYADGTDTAINASYILVQDTDPTQKPCQKIKFAHKHKLNKKIKTSFSLSKSLESDQPENKASFDFIYVY